jgi:hypothetical protein
MNTRSKTRLLLQQLDFHFDFDHSSECWKENKKSVGNGCYTYICGFLLKNGNRCQRVPLKNQDLCCIHNKKCFIKKTI